MSGKHSLGRGLRDLECGGPTPLSIAEPQAVYEDAGAFGTESGVKPPHSKSNAGAVLLEVVLALVLIAAAGAVIGAGLSASIDRVERLKLNAHAADLAVSVMSELQMGSKVISEDGPEMFEAPFENWTWEAQAEMTDEKVRDTGRTKKIEVIIRHEDPAVVYRLAQIIRLPEKEEDVLLEFAF